MLSNMVYGVTIGQGEWIIILVVLLLLFGSTQLPKLARSLGSAQKEFRKGMDDAAAEGDGDDADEDSDDDASDASSASAKSGRSKVKSRKK